MPFCVADNWYLRDYVHEIRPSYTPASSYVLSRHIIDSEYVRVLRDDQDRLKAQRGLTLLFDGWEDALKRSLYGTIAAKVNQYPIPLSLDDITGQRGTWWKSSKSCVLY